MLLSTVLASSRSQNTGGKKHGPPPLGGQRICRSAGQSAQAHQNQKVASLYDLDFDHDDDMCV